MIPVSINPISIATPTTITNTALEEPQRPFDKTPWGWHLVLNLYDCDPETIRSYHGIYQFVIDLCDLIEMRRFGEPIIVDFGDDPVVSGYSLLQLIETSNICGHFANQSNSAYLDIFSCKSYDPDVATDFCARTFKAQKIAGTFIARD